MALLSTFTEEPVGGNTTIYGAYNMNNWYNDRTVTRSGNNQNEFKLGDFTNFNLYGTIFNRNNVKVVDVVW